MTPSLIGWAYVVNVLWDQEVCFPCTSELYALGVSLLWVIWTLLLWLGLYCCFPIHERTLLLGWLTVSLRNYHIVWAAVQVLTGKIKTKENWSKQIGTYKISWHSPWKQPKRRENLEKEEKIQILRQKKRENYIIVNSKKI